MKIIPENKKDKLYLHLKQAINSELYSAGMRLPKEVELAAEFNVARDTLRPALERLAEEGVILRIKGKGTFVSPEPGGCGKILIVMNDEPELYNPCQYIMPGIQAAGKELNIPLDICSYHLLKTTSVANAVISIKNSRSRGVILLANAFSGDEKVLEILRQSALPVLIPHGHPNDTEVTGFDSMVVDFRQVFHLAFRHLAENGHRRVGGLFMPAPNEELRRVPEREYKQILENYSLDSDSDLICRVEYDLAAVEKEIRRLLEMPCPPTALFCFSDFYAIYTYEILARCGVLIPDDMAIISIGGHSGCDYLTPGLSSVNLNYFDIGHRALQHMKNMIMQRINGKFNSGNIMVNKPGLSVRGSTAQNIKKETMNL